MPSNLTLLPGSFGSYMLGDICHLPGYTQSCRCLAWHSLCVKVAYSLGVSVLFLLMSPGFLLERAVAMNMAFGAVQAWIECTLDIAVSQFSCL